MPNFFYQLHFYLFGLIAIASAVAFVTRKSPVAAVLWLVNTMFALAAIYVMMSAHFIGVIQILVYAGAIMVVFLFVVMLLNLGHVEEIADIRGKWVKLAAGLAGLVLLAQVMVMARSSFPETLIQRPEVAEQQLRDLNAVGVIAEPLFREHLLAFELTSLVLLVAIVGAIVLGKRRSVV